MFSVVLTTTNVIIIILFIQNKMTFGHECHNFVLLFSLLSYFCFYFFFWMKIVRVYLKQFGNLEKNYINIEKNKTCFVLFSNRHWLLLTKLFPSLQGFRLKILFTNNTSLTVTLFYIYFY